MKRRSVVGLALVAVGGVAAGCATGGGGGGGALEAQFTQEIAPILTANCVGCHGGARTSAGVNLVFANYAEAQARDEAFWNRVSAALSSGRMPPATAPSRPTDAQRARLISWIGDNLVD